MMPQDTPTACNGCGNKSFIEHALSFPKGCLVLERYNNAAKEWGALGIWSLTPSAIFYKPQINSRSVHGERTRAGELMEGGADDGGTNIDGESQWGGRNGCTRDRADELGRSPLQVEGPAESRADVSAHGFWNQGTTIMFDVIIVNLDARSYLRMTP